jgi:hypothetical protein
MHSGDELASTKLDRRPLPGGVVSKSSFFNSTMPPTAAFRAKPPERGVLTADTARLRLHSSPVKVGCSHQTLELPHYRLVEGGLTASSWRAADESEALPPAAQSRLSIPASRLLQYLGRSSTCNGNVHWHFQGNNKGAVANYVPVFVCLVPVLAQNCVRHIGVSVRWHAVGRMIEMLWCTS